MGAPDGPEQRARPAQKTLFPKIFGGLIPIPKRWRLRRAGRSLALIALGMALGSLLLAYLSAGEIYEYQDSVDGVHLPPVDAIVCLAGGRGRIAAAGDIWYRYWEIVQGPPVRGAGLNPVPNTPPVLYISGMGHLSNWHVLAKQVRRGVLPMLKSENVVLETESENTEENARWLVKYAKQRGWEKILLVTSRYHMRRSRYIFSKVIAAMGEKLEIETLSVYQEPFEPGEWRASLHGIRVTLWEYLKWIYYQRFWRPVA